VSDVAVGVPIFPLLPLLKIKFELRLTLQPGFEWGTWFKWLRLYVLEKRKI
jgi:hypothetical protein